MTLDSESLAVLGHGGPLRAFVAADAPADVAKGEAAVLGAATREAGVASSFLLSNLPSLPGGSSTAGGLAAAAGAAAGGKFLYMYCSKKCVAPAACFALKSCLDSCANKAFAAGAAGAGVSGFAGSKLHQRFGKGEGPWDEWTAGPVMGAWNRLENVAGGVWDKPGMVSQRPRLRRSSKTQYWEAQCRGDFL
mmetsp:Transcript_24945/g.58005  ORF Transcript_24945/g.58005 Transcript_24945/m.58005 type:complete len:192 (+) Transcript_24945:113-688(+)|eukprot:CAMPEP_0171127338 /NCGR_PEP_ID=MMETSP0766_2-20121228/115076_1 /TAXON_ID=439317 /ORGANISM="Gambierdiscus australes, Strain CAWD 149" /LENGTH=191 /DNA_ID=CAMNT_0011590429 /DNA_START=49 /DNA_END=624 /DNA_ORIENTATION=+